eukprot:333637_1
MSSVTIDERWMECPAIPSGVRHGIPVMLNQNEIMMVSSYYAYVDKENIYGIHKYDNHTNNWEEVFKYKENLDLTIKNHRITINKETKKIYIQCSWYHKLLVFDISNNSLQLASIDHKSLLLDQWGSLYPGFLNINHDIHAIGGTKNPKHKIWNTENGTIQTVNAPFERNKLFEIYAPSTIYVPSQQILLLIGGLCSIGQYEYLDDNISVGVWKFHLKSKKWQKIEGLTFDFHRTCCAMTSDEKYVIISEGYTNDTDQPQDDMYILDIRNANNYKLWKCDIQCPVTPVGAHYIVKTGNALHDEMLVFGWVKKIFDTPMFKDLLIPPTYIIQSIVMWYNQEEIHWLEYGMEPENRHYAINVRHIVSSSIGKRKWEMMRKRKQEKANNILNGILSQQNDEISKVKLLKEFRKANKGVGWVEEFQEYLGSFWAFCFE